MTTKFCPYKFRVQACSLFIQNIDRTKFITVWSTVKRLLLIELKNLPITCLSLAMILCSLSLSEAFQWGFK